jgi:hypothetical protein
MNRYNPKFKACDHGVQEAAYNGKYTYVYTVGVRAQVAAIESHKQMHIRDVPGGMCQTSGGCSLC